MTRDQCVAVIWRECSTLEGFLVQLRAGNFRESNYAELMQALQEYSSIIAHEEMIERKMASCLPFLDLQFRAATYALFQNDPERLAKLTQLQEDCSELVEEILSANIE